MDGDPGQADVVDPLDVIVPDKWCSANKAHPIRVRDAKPGGGYYTKCSPCRVKNSIQQKKRKQAAKAGDSGWKPKPGDSPDTIVPGLKCSIVISHPIRVRDAKPGGGYYAACSSCREKDKTLHIKTYDQKRTKNRIAAASKLPPAFDSLYDAAYKARYGDRPKDVSGSQPNWPTGKSVSTSQPDSAASSRASTSGIKRFRSEGDEVVEHHQDELSATSLRHLTELGPFQKRVFQILRHRLDNAGVDTSVLQLNTSAWCLPTR